MILVTPKQEVEPEKQVVLRPSIFQLSSVWFQLLICMHPIDFMPPINICVIWGAWGSVTIDPFFHSL